MSVDEEACRAATKLAQKAIDFDHAQRYDEAIFFYVEASNRMLDLLNNKKMLPGMKRNVVEYLERAEFLKKELPRLKGLARSTRSEDTLEFERAEFLVCKGVLYNDEGKKDAAMEAYQEAISICLERGRRCRNAELCSKMKFLANEALQYAEVLHKEQQAEKELEMLNKLPDVPVDGLNQLHLDDKAPPVCGKPAASLPASPASAKKSEQLGKDELAVLAATSKINGRSYVPFLSKDLGEKFNFALPFTDKDGKLSLTEKQKKKLAGWMRPEEFMEEPMLIRQIDSGTIKQTVVSDCSFVASLTIAARYERRFKTQVVTSIIFPQNKNGQPVYNSCGKYMVKLHINGVWRKVIVDDVFPVGEGGVLLCSYSQQSELWVSILEKAYLKVMGGYDFPGSNSNIDLHALTGWIPERIAIRKDPTEFDPDRVFEKLLTRFHRGDCLITLATGKMDEAEADRAGLVDCHAYALLDLRKIDGKRLLMVKNPWTHLRWKGRFSEKDEKSWTPELKKALDYDPSTAQERDDGVFWIDYESVIHFFDVFYVNWNTALFPFTYGIHAEWKSVTGPVKDLYSVAANPQYSLEVNNKTSAAVWILLTRHITDIADFADNKEYITVMVYKSGKKVYIPFDPKPLYDGVRINSPHYLCQMVITDPGVQRYSLVVAQYEKTTTIYYTLRVYSTVDFKLAPMKVPYTTEKTVKGEWKGKSAGGCGNGPSRETFSNNPTYELSLEESSDDHSVLIELKAPKQYSVGVAMRLEKPTREGKTFEKTDSGHYRPGYTVLTVEGIPAGTYHIRVSTFIAGQEGPFILLVHSSHGFTLKRIQ